MITKAGRCCKVLRWWGIIVENSLEEIENGEQLLRLIEVKAIVEKFLEVDGKSWVVESDWGEGMAGGTEAGLVPSAAVLLAR